MSYVKPLMFGTVALLMFGCQNRTELPDWAAALDENGLRNGQVAQDFEFCFAPDAERFAQLQNIYPNLQAPTKSPGRSQCADGEWLVIGNSHLAGFHQHFANLLQQVGEISPTHWE